MPTFSRLRSKRRLVNCIVLILFLVSSWTCRKVAVRPSPDDGKTWPQFGGRPDRANVSPFTIHPPLNNLWIYKTSSALTSTMLAVDGALYFTTLDGRYEILEIATGKRLARGKCEGQYEAAIAYRSGYLLFASRYGENTLAKYDLARGKFAWKIDAGDIASEPLLADGVYVSAIYDHVDKYDFESGEKIWTFKTGEQIRSSPALKDRVLVFGCDDGAVYALNSQNGKLLWKMETGASVSATPIMSGERIFIGSADSTFYALRLTDGAPAWKFSAMTPIYQSAASDGRRVLFGASDGQFYCLSAESGDELWRFRAGSSISTAPLVVGETVYFGSLDRRYYCLDLQSGALLWSFETKGRIRTAPVVWGNYLLGASEDRFVYAFAPMDSAAGYF